MPRCLFSPHPNPPPQGQGILLVPRLQLSPLCISRPKPIISAGMPKSSVQGWQHWATTDVPISKDIQLRAFKRTYQAFAQPTGYRPWPGFRHPCRNECAREGISSTWCKSMSKEAINFVAEGNCVAARRGGEQPEAKDRSVG